MWVLVAGLGAAAVAIGIGQTQRGTSPPPSRFPEIQQQGGVAWIRMPLAGPAAALPVAVSVEQGRIRCRRTVPGARILVLTFQRRAGRAAYGVYALAGAKRDLLLDPPLDGDPIAWPDRDAPAALAYQLELAGLDASEAARFVELAAGALLDDGSRVLLTMPAEVATTIPTYADRLRGSDAHRVFLVALDVELP